MNKSYLSIEVAFARADKQKIIQLRVAAGTTVADAIRQSGITQFFPEIDLVRNRIGIFGRLTKPDAILRDRDRVEIYRPLISDPKEVRRKRAEEGKATKKGSGGD